MNTLARLMTSLSGPRCLQATLLSLLYHESQRAAQASDPAQLAYAQREGRVLVTHDADFLRLAAQAIDHPGIAYCHKPARSLGEIIRSLILIHEVLTPEEIAGRVEYL